MSRIVVGVGFGTFSGRAVMVSVTDGKILASAEHTYPYRVINRKLTDQSLPPDWALQVPADYVEVLSKVVPEALETSGVGTADVVGLVVDFTSYTVPPTGEAYRPLCERPEFEKHPHAYVKLWGHHTSQRRGKVVNKVLAELTPETLARYGDEVSTDQQLAKALALFEEDREAWDAANHFVEAGDQIVQFPTDKMTASMSLTDYRGSFVDSSYPSAKVLGAMAPGFSRLLELIPHPVARPGERVGSLTAETAALTGLPESIAVAATNIGAHVTAPVANTCEPGQLTLIMGISTCHMMTSESFGEVLGVGGVVPDGIVKGLWGYEVGQAGMDDTFGRFIDNCVPPSHVEMAMARGVGVHEYLAGLAARQQAGEHGLLTLDWHSGNRSILDDTELTRLMLDTTLTTTPEGQYRALLESAAFGIRVIIEAFQEAGIEMNNLVVTGGLMKSPLFMQIYADVTNLPLATCLSVASGAHESAIYVAVAVGEYAGAREAAPAMAHRKTTPETVFAPIPENVATYDDLYRERRRLHDHFDTGENDVMHRLKARRRGILVTKSTG